MISLTIRSQRSGQTTRCDDADGVSLTANPRGFTPFLVVVSTYEWDGEYLASYSDKTNARGEVCVIPDTQPMAFLVPRSHGKATGNFLISDLIDAVEHLKIQKLHFAHYFFILHKLPVAEITVIFKHLKERKNETLKEIVFDIDSRFESEIRQIYTEVFERSGN
jgi:hypothetical protein